MGLGSLPERKRPPGCATTASRVILYLIILAVAIAFVRVIIPPNGLGARNIVATESRLGSLTLALEQYRTVNDAYPPDRAVGLHPDLDKPSECLVYYLSGASIIFVPGASPPDYPWRHPVFQDNTPGRTGRSALSIHYDFKTSILNDTDGDGIPEVMDLWRVPLVYNSGPAADGPYNQHGATRHIIGRFDLFSAGPDKQFGTADDLNNWGDRPAAGDDYDYGEINRSTRPSR